MKTILSISICVLFLGIPFTSVGQSTSISSTQLIPLTIGNYWVYSNSDDAEKFDTVKITRTKIIRTDTGYYYNGNLWLERNDSVYEFQSQRSGSIFPTLQYFSSDKPVEYGIVIGGDVLSRRSVTKLKAPYTVKGKEYLNCYEFAERREKGYVFTIISKGIGIIEIRSPERTRSLTEYKIED
ncbi:MAG: hypothetical protein M3R27_07370 [Bacteroidota bacterium]|nr:hypothetical protein [Bacteroidota bacterium]